MPAEGTAITATAFTARLVPAARQVPIGRPIAKVSASSPDAHLRRLPAGCAGETVIGGVGVGERYLNQPDPTAARCHLPTRSADNPPNHRMLYTNRRPGATGPDRGKIGTMEA